MSQRDRVLQSLFASTGGNEPTPLSRHISEVEFLRVAVRWFVAIQRDREENGPLSIPSGPVNGPVA